MERFKNSKLFFWTLEVFLIILTIFVLSQLTFVLEPLKKFFSAIFLPIIFAGFLFYLLNPVVNFISKIKIGNKKIDRKLSVTITVIMFFSFLIWMFTYLAKNLVSQIISLSESIPKSVEFFIKQFSNLPFANKINAHEVVDVVQKNISLYVSKVTEISSAGLGTVSSFLTGVFTFFIILITVLTMLVYMLYDSHKLKPFILKFFPKNDRSQAGELLTNLSNTLSRYIGGQVIEALFVSVGTIIGYALIGLPYALLLGIIEGVTVLIPYLGVYLGTLPAVIVALNTSWVLAIEVIVVVTIIQQIDGNLIYPNVIGKTLQIHPMTIIVLLLASGNVWGIIGMLLAIPTYAIIKTIVRFAYKMYLLRKKDSLTKN